MVRATQTPDRSGDYERSKQYRLGMHGIEAMDDGLVIKPYLHDAVLIQASLGPPLELSFRGDGSCFKLTAPEGSLLWCSGPSLGGIVSQTFAFDSHDELERVVSRAHSDLSVDCLMRSIVEMRLRPCGLFFLMNYLDDVVLFVKDLSMVLWSEIQLPSGT